MAGRTAVPLRRRPSHVRRALQLPVRQTGYNFPSNGADAAAVTVTLGAPTISGGSLLVAVAGFWGSGNFAAGNVTDNYSNVFAFDFEVSTGSGEACVGFYSCSNFVGGSNHQITVTNGAVTGKALGVVEYTRRVTFDKSASAVDDTTSPFTSGTTTTLTAQPGIAIAACAVDTGANAAFTPDPDWAQIGERENGTVDLVNNQVYKVLQSTAAEDAGWTWAGTFAGNGAQAGIVTYYDFTSPPGGFTRTDRGTHQQGPSGGTINMQIVTSDWTPTAGSFLVAVVQVNAKNDSGSSGDITSALSDNFGDSGGTAWTSSALSTRGSIGAGQYMERVQAFTRTIGTGPGSGHLTWNGTNPGSGTTTTDGWFTVHIWEFTGQNSTPVGLVAQPARIGGGATTYDANFSGTPAASSYVVGGVHSDNQVGPAIGAPTGYSEVDELDPAWGAISEWVEISGSSPQNNQWTGFVVTSGIMGVLVEVVAGGGAVAAPAPRRARPRIVPVAAKKRRA